MSNADQRPVWVFKDAVPEELARWIWGNPVTKITHHWEYTGADTARYWLELHADKGKRRIPDTRLPRGVNFAPNHAGLLRLDQSVEDLLHKIAAWEKKHEHEIAEYERMKAALFGGATASPRHSASAESPPIPDDR
jgi:hypothetical protein